MNKSAREMAEAVFQRSPSTQVVVVHDWTTGERLEIRFYRGLRAILNERELKQ